jgi:predicted MFS family arabinose efflux permease
VISGPFHRLAWSNLAAQGAEQIALGAVPIVAVLALGAGVGETGLLAAAQSLPFLLLSLPAGLLADRVRRGTLMASAEGVRAAILLGLLLCVVYGSISVPILALFGFAAAAGTVAFSVAAPALVPALVPRRDLAAANGRLELARSTAFAAGPALAGAFLAWTGAEAAFAVAATLSIAAAFLLGGISEPARPAAARISAVAQLREGAVFACGHDLLRPILLTAVAWNVSWFVLQAAFVPYAAERLGLSAAGIGLTLGCYGVGMVAGALVAGRASRHLPFGWLIATGPLVSVAAAVAMTLSIWFPQPELAGLAFFLFGAGPLVWTVGQTTLRQAVTPERMLGRVSALMMTATSGARPVGAALGALVGAGFGATPCIVLAALGFVVQALVILGSPVPRLATLPEPVAP